jgi:hypothetical protein
MLNFSFPDAPPVAVSKSLLFINLISRLSERATLAARQLDVQYQTGPLALDILRAISDYENKVAHYSVEYFEYAPIPTLPLPLQQCKQRVAVCPCQREEEEEDGNKKWETLALPNNNMEAAVMMLTNLMALKRWGTEC